MVLTLLPTGAFFQPASDDSESVSGQPCASKQNCKCSPHIHLLPYPVYASSIYPSPTPCPRPAPTIKLQVTESRWFDLPYIYLNCTVSHHSTPTVSKYSETHVLQHLLCTTTAATKFSFCSAARAHLHRSPTLSHPKDGMLHPLSRP